MENKYRPVDLIFDEAAPDAIGVHEIDDVQMPYNGRGKKSFLVFKNNKYMIVPTENIAFFYIKYTSPVILSFDRKEYSVNYSLKEIQNLVGDKQFFRLNKRYLVSFNAVKEVEHYFARKLLVQLTVPAPEKLLVAKEKASHFLHWLENR